MPATAQPTTLTGKTPAEVLNYLADFSAEIAANEPGDTIATINSIGFKGAPATLYAAAQAINQAATGVMLRLAAGSAGVTYTVTLNVTMASGMIFERSFLLPVVAARG